MAVTNTTKAKQLYNSFKSIGQDNPIEPSDLKKAVSILRALRLELEQNNHETQKEDTPIRNS